MRVLGIDCGTEWTGYGVVDTDRAGELYSVCHGAIHLSKRDSLPHRLTIIFHRLMELVGEHQPEVVAIEEVFHAVNAQTALNLARFAALLYWRRRPVKSPLRNTPHYPSSQPSAGMAEPIRSRCSSW